MSKRYTSTITVTWEGNMLDAKNIEEYILKGIKSEAETAEKSDTRLKALFKLSDIMDLEDKNQTKVTQISGAVFKGFGETQLEEVERPKELKE